MDKWIVALGFGAVVVGIYSWGRFDEPSCDGESEYFARYTPRFSTSPRRYWRAKWAYIGAITLLYFVLAVVPEILTALVVSVDAKAEQAKLGDVWVPLAAALGLMTLDKMPVLKDIERKIRGFLHAFARIPECVRRTVAQMKSSPFNFAPRVLTSLARKLAVPAGSDNQPANLSTLLAEDDLVHTWYTVGALLCALSERNRDQTGIDALFFESYKDEFDSIADKHVALAELVREHLVNRSSTDAAEYSMPREIRDLRDRLYTFVACGVHSSVKVDAQSLEIIRRLGFAIRPTNERKTSFVTQLAGLTFAALIVVSVFTGYSTQIFRDHFVAPLSSQWKAVLPIPADAFGFYAWSWTTAAYYFAAIMGALAVRNSRVAKREWFDITNLERERPILRYITPTLVGTLLGFLTLSTIALIGGPAFNASGDVSWLGIAVSRISQSLPWVPLALVMACASVALSDSRFKNGGFWRAAPGRAACGAAAMAIVGFFTGELSVSGVIAAANDSLGDAPATVLKAGHYLSGFIAAQIGLFAFVLCIIAQVAERYTARARCFAGQCVEVATRQGTEFRMFFDADGSASLLSRDQGDAAPRQWQGQWQLFPEGTAVRWNIADGETCKAGAFGLISWYGDSLIYEGYTEGFAGTADFVGQVHVRPGMEGSRNRAREALIAASQHGVPEPALREPAGEPAVS